MKVNILQFENATMQALHEKAATVANAAVIHGPFVGGWWEHYLSVVIKTAQAEQRVAWSKDVAEIRGFYDEMARDLDAANERTAQQQHTIDGMNAEHTRLVNELAAANAEVARVRLLLQAPSHLDAEALHDTAIEGEAGNVQAVAATSGAKAATDGSADIAAPATKPAYDNPATHTARPNPFSK